MRLAVAAVALVVAVGAAQATNTDPPTAVKAFLNIAVIGGFLERNCQEYRLNLYEFEKFAASAKINIQSITSAYPEYFAQQNAFMRDRTDVSKDNLCRYFADAFGEHGSIPNMVIRR